MTLASVFVETQFPTDISYNSAGGAGFSTTIYQSSSGREQRNSNWSKSALCWSSLPDSGPPLAPSGFGVGASPPIVPPCGRAAARACALH